MSPAMPTPHGPSVSAPVERVRLQPSALLFRLYKAVLSPVLHTAAPSRCLYLPTCSEYAYTAVSRFGFFRGSWLAARRLLRCHPWAKGGLDPVPEHLHAPPNNPGAAPDCASQRGPNHLP